MPRTLFQQYHLSRSNRKKLGVCSTGSLRRAFLTCTNATWHSSIHCSRSWTPFQRGPLGAGQLYKVQNEPVVISSQPQNHLISFFFFFFFWFGLGHVQAVMVVIFSICGCTFPPSTAITLCVHSLCCRELIILQYDYTNKPVLCSKQLYSHRVSCSSILSLQVLLLLK